MQSFLTERLVLQINQKWNWLMYKWMGTITTMSSSSSSPPPLLYIHIENKNAVTYLDTTTRLLWIYDFEIGIHALTCMFTLFLIQWKVEIKYSTMEVSWWYSLYNYTNHQIMYKIIVMSIFIERLPYTTYYTDKCLILTFTALSTL